MTKKTQKLKFLCFPPLAYIHTYMYTHNLITGYVQTYIHTNTVNILWFYYTELTHQRINSTTYTHLQKKRHQKLIKSNHIRNLITQEHLVVVIESRR